MWRSLPSRERVLKQAVAVIGKLGKLSLPSRERVLKLCKSLCCHHRCGSLPSRERVLKRYYCLRLCFVAQAFHLCVKVKSLGGFNRR